MKYLISASLSLIITAGLSMSAIANTVTAKTTLKRGSQISLQDIEIETNTVAEYERLASQYVGKSVLRTIRGGMTLKDRDVGEPIQVRRNSRVKMVYRMGRLEISATGRALDQGSIGDIISVMNLDSRKRVEGRVTGQGTVEMMP